jgi:hypothetical protein
MSESAKQYLLTVQLKSDSDMQRLARDVPLIIEWLHHFQKAITNPPSGRMTASYLDFSLRRPRQNSCARNLRSAAAPSMATA